MCLCAYEAWGSGLIKGLGFDTDRKRERERGSETELIEMACAWLTGAVRDKAPAKPRPLEQLFLHAAFGLVQWKEAYVWPGATLPPRLTAEDAGRVGEKETERLELEYKLY